MVLEHFGSIKQETCWPAE